MCLSPSIHGEGSEEVGSAIGLSKNTELRIRIVDPAVEAIHWSGAGNATIRRPDSTLVGLLASGDSISTIANIDGDYIVELGSDQAPGGLWDITVKSAGAEKTGRLWSDWWLFLQSNYSDVAALNASLFAVVDSGSANETAVIEMKADGMNGNDMGVLANSGATLGRLISVPIDQAPSPQPEFPIYLNPPEVADYSSIEPTLANLELLGGGPDGSVIFQGEQAMEFVFESDANGVYHLICDLDDDAVFDLTGQDDYVDIGPVITGANSVFWDGRDNTGSQVAIGQYNCRLRITTGSMLVDSYDTETSYTGYRLFEVDAGLRKNGLVMFWNDSPVQSNAVIMPNGQYSLESSGPAGVGSGIYADAASPNVNSRAWGDFNVAGFTNKGNDTLLRTLVWLNEDQSEEMLVTISLPDGVFADGFEVIARN